MPRGQAPARFLSLSCVPQSREALSPAICLPALGIVIPKYRPVNISLVTATPSTIYPAKNTKLRKGRRLLAHSAPLPFVSSLSTSVSFHPPEPQMHNEGEKISLL